MIRMQSLFSNKLVKNLSWIFVGNVLHAILAFVLSVAAARCFLKDEYGVLNYALSLATLCTSICTLGLNVIITKEFADREESKGEVIASCVVLRIIASFIAIAIMLFYVYAKNGVNRDFYVCSIYSLNILFSSFDLIVYWFRYKYKSNISAIDKLSAFLFSALLKGVAIWKNSIILFAIGAAVEVVLFAVLLSGSYIRRYGFDLHCKTQRARKLWKTTRPFVFSSILVAIYGQTDKIMLEAMVGYDAVAQYSVSLTIANVVAIVLMSLTEAFRPEILKAKNESEKKYRSLLTRLYGLTFWCCLLYGVCVTVFRTPILHLLYGNKYDEAKNTLPIIVWYLSFAYFGAINNIYLIAENKSKWVRLITIVATITNVAVNYLMIPIMGAAGAALASLLTQLIANFVFPFIVKQLRDMGVLSVKGIVNVRDLFRKTKT